MKNPLLKRLEMLEALVAPVASIPYRIGVLKTLPADFVGERHIVIVNEKPSGSCEFEERPGPAPPGEDDGVPRIYLTEAEANM